MRDRLFPEVENMDCYFRHYRPILGTSRLWNGFTLPRHGSVHLCGTASRCDKTRQTRFLVGEMVLLGANGQRSAAPPAQPEIGEGICSIPGKTVDFEKPGSKSSIG